VVRWILLRGLLGSALLVLAGLTYARVPAHSRVLLFPWRLRADHLALGLCLATAGLVLLTWAWLSLVRRVSGEAAGVRWARLATLAWTVPLLAAPPLFSNDGWSYVATGYLAGHGWSPYDVTPSILSSTLRSGVDPVWRSTTSPYGPLPLMWGGAFSRLTADPWLLLVANRLLAFVGLALLALAVPVLARRAGVDPARASAVALASPLVVAHGIGGLHNDLLLVGLMAVALALTRRQVWWWGAMATGAAAAVKLPGMGIGVGVVLLSLVPGAVVAVRLRRAVQVFLTAAATLLGLSAASGLGLGWTHGLDRSTHELARLAPTAVMGHWMHLRLQALGPHGVRLIQELRPERTLEHAGLVALAAIALWILLRRPVPDDSAAICGGALVLLAATLLIPTLHYWYFLWALPLLACARLSTRAEHTLLASLAALGLTAVADPAIHVSWFAPVALLALVLVPAVVWTADPVLDRSVGRRAAQRRTLGRR
jgi:Glycosyltransferase family 87